MAHLHVVFACIVFISSPSHSQTHSAGDIARNDRAPRSHLPSSSATVSVGWAGTVKPKLPAIASCVPGLVTCSPVCLLILLTLAIGQPSPLVDGAFIDDLQWMDMSHTCTVSHCPLLWCTYCTPCLRLTWGYACMRPCVFVMVFYRYGGVGVGWVWCGVDLNANGCECICM